MKTFNFTITSFCQILILNIYFRRDQNNSRLPRSVSIDSIVETVWNTSPRPSLTVPPPQNQLQINYGCQTEIRRESLLSPSTSRRAKQNRGITCE